MGFYYDDDEDDDFNESSRSFSGPVLMTISLVSGLILIILLLVLASNNTSSGKNNLKNSQMMNPVQTPDSQSAVDVAKSYIDEHGNKDIEELYKDKKLRSEDLDFWDMYKNNESNVVVEQPTPTQEDADLESDNSDTEDTDEENSEDEDLNNEEESELIEGVPLNSVELTNLKSIDNKMQYSINDRVVSKLGVIVSEDNGIVNFTTLKDNGVDFVMLKVGERGYDSGRITEDSKFETNLKAASDAGLEIGLLFSSRAVTKNEATEEANFVTDKVRGYIIEYPIAYTYDGETFASSRTDILDREDLSDMANAFLSQIHRDGYEPILYGTENYIMNDIYPDKVITDYEVWLNDTSSIPTYQYQYTMWKYRNDVAIPGMERNGDYVISFIDYSKR